MTDRHDLVIGLDFGTSSLKGALFDREGNVHAQARAGYELHLQPHGVAEQDPQDWWKALKEVVGVLTASTPAAERRLRALSLSAQMCGVVPVDASGEALRPCMTWLDTRSATFAKAMMGGWPRFSGYGIWRLLLWLRLTNGAPNLAGKDVTSKYRWLEKNEADLWRKTAKLLDVKDWLLQKLTGAFVTSEDCAHLTWLMDARHRQRRWSPTLIRLTKIDGGKLPDIVKAAALMGPLRTQTAKELGLPDGLPVVAGCGDLCSVALGSGVRQIHIPHLNVGTSSWIGTLTDRQMVDPKTGIGTICAADGVNYLLIATQEAAGASLAWAARMLFPDKNETERVTALNELAKTVPPNAQSAMFFPWMYGERVPINDDRARGIFANLSLATSRAELARAVIEGVALNTRWALEAVEKLIGKYQDSIRVMGGVAQSPFLVQCLADTLNKPLQIMDRPALAGARGAAMLAALGAGWFENIEATAAMARVGHVITPGRNAGELAKARFAVYKRTYERFKTIQGRFSALTQDAPAF
jgi:xylulokinase